MTCPIPDYIACAPMEGVTRAVFRSRHHSRFGGADQYFVPFLSPSADGVFSPKELREVLPEHCAGVPTVPQLMAGRAEHFLWAAKLMGELGYRQVDLNLGCPSGTVVAKHKGSGLLADPGALDRFLHDIFEGMAGTGVALSAKTRMGLEDPGEFPAILAVLKRYPFCQLTVHPRLRRQFYQGSPSWEAYGLAQEHISVPLCYNGDIFTGGDYARLRERFPRAGRVMLGRGLVADPALPRVLRGGPPLERKELRAFHDDLLEDYRGCIQGEINVLHKMKELWNYWEGHFPEDKKGLKALRKSKTVKEYLSAAEALHW